MLRKEIGLRVKNIRLSMNMTKQKMAELLGISGQYLGMIERGEGTLSVDKLKILCDMTGLSADYILFGKDFNSTLNLSKKLSGYSDEEIAMFEELLRNNAHLLYKYAENGGIQIA